MKTVVINSCYGGYGNISKEAYDYLIQHDASHLVRKYDNLFGRDEVSYHIDEEYRDHPVWVSCVRELKEKAGASASKYELYEYDETKYAYNICEYDGLESVELIPILDVIKMSTMTIDEWKEYLDSKGYLHN